MNLRIFPGFLLCLSLLQRADGAVLPHGDAFDLAVYAAGAPIAGQQGWISTGSGNSPQAVVLEDPTGSGRGGVLQLGNTANGGSEANAVALPFEVSDASKASNPRSGGDLRFRFDLYGYLPSADYLLPWVLIGDIHSELYSVFLEVSASGVVALNGGALVVPGIALQAERWYSFTIDLFHESRTYALSITDGTSSSALAEVPFWHDSLGIPVPENNAIAFRNSHNFGLFENEGGYIDQLSIVPIPEPASLSALGLISLGGWLLVRKRRKGKNPVLS